MHKACLFPKSLARAEVLHPSYIASKLEPRHGRDTSILQALLHSSLNGTSIFDCANIAWLQAIGAKDHRSAKYCHIYEREPSVGQSAVGVPEYPLPVCYFRYFVLR